MRPVAELDPAACRELVGILFDVDDTVTSGGKIVPEALVAMRDAQRAGLRVVPVTGRPGGWVDHLARMWPVDGAVGENGGLWFWMQDGRMHRRFAQPADERAANRARLEALRDRILREVPGTALASDQPYRDLDLAIDFCEDVPRLDDAAIDRIVAIFREGGATAKVSSIHVNGWFGSFDKWSGCVRLVVDRWGEDLAATTDRWAFFGDSPNDEPMFARFRTSIGVANVARLAPRMRTLPAFVTQREGGEGFAEGVRALLASR